jgi:heat shock protein HtpX
MARTRFIGDAGLTARMTLVMFLLGALLVAFVAVLLGVFGNSPTMILLIGGIGLGVVWFQWYNSDTLALKAMRAREVASHEAPELHAVIDRLCALADMPKPRVAISYSDMPNAFATGRSPNRAAVCVTTGLLDRLSAEEVEAVLAHELSHVAHRDVLVMTMASSAGIIAGMATRGAQYGAIFGGGRRDNNSGAPVWLVVLVVSIVTYAVSFFLTRLLSRYRELSADRAGAFLTGKPSALASALTKITGDISHIPNKDLRSAQPMNAFFIAPAVAGLSWKTITSTHPSLEQRLEQLAKVSAELGRPLDGGFSAGPEGPLGPLGA